MRIALAAIGFALLSTTVLAQSNSGNITAFVKDDQQGAYAFEARGSKLFARFVTGLSFGVDWESHGAPLVRGTVPLVAMSDAAVVSYSAPSKPGVSSQRLEAFVVQGGRLFSRSWDGDSWQWKDLGKPSTATLASTEAPGVATYLQSDFVTRRTHVFIRSTEGDLYELTRTGEQMQWTSHGHPPVGQNGPNGYKVNSGASVISYVEGGVRRLYAFVHTANETLWVRYSTGGAFQWADQGNQADRRPSAISYMQDGTQRIYVFVRKLGFYGDHLLNYWNGNAWNWVTTSEPFEKVQGHPHAITLNDGGVRKIFLFTIGVEEANWESEGDKTGHLWSYIWDGFQWTWTRHVWGPQDIDEVLGTVTYLNQGARTYVVIVKLPNGDIWQDRYENGVWSWVNLGQP
jgi:hypothetical protein